ncbi:hypothetical protein HDU96_001778 [Phlyctochytrium bullatum]|nr:hypothetical protein HDU96_001778 [Phlyctochytrium bullatum]
MNISAPVSSEVVGISFSFYSTEELRKLSVKAIYNPVLLDTQGHPSAGGLYDPALGPIEKGDSCTTCSLSYFSCPGHFGHIELATPAYNPITFRLMYKLLQSTCYYCHRLRISRVLVHHFSAKLKLVRAGLVVQAVALDEYVKTKVGRAGGAAATKKGGAKKGGKKKTGNEDEDEDEEEGEEEEEEEEEVKAETTPMDVDEDSMAAVDAFLAARPQSEEAIITAINDYVHDKFAEADIDPDKAASRTVKSTMVTDTIRKLERQILASISPGACPGCRGISPKFRKDGISKIFEKELPAKSKTRMSALKKKYEDVFKAEKEDDMPHVNGSASAEGQVPEDSEGQTRLAQSIRAAEVPASEDGDSDDDDDDDDDDAEEEVGARVAAGRSSSARDISNKEVTSSIIKEDKARYLSSIEVRAHLRVLWKREKSFLDLLYGASTARGQPRTSSADRLFFLEVVPVPPSKFRPASKMGEMLFEDPQNTHLSAILKTNDQIRTLRKEQRDAAASGFTEAANQLVGKIAALCIKLQDEVGFFIDSSKAPLQKGKEAPPGVRQILEKKEGLFRKHMMGKRVNFAARSVISPDPYIETNEIGVPPVFASKLTYPEPVTHHNVEKLRQAVINGPRKWPGATAVEMEDGSVTSLDALDEVARTGLANQLLTPTVHADDSGRVLPHTNKKVHRHLRNGDFLILNRQPTLHKPSMMAHTARVLPGERTIRMHYANCNTYNADFDGDEMNIHFPQNEIARAEAMLIARNDHQYLVPTDGGVLRGLIQDHVDAGVDMSSRDCFFRREEYFQLVYGALRPEPTFRTGGIGNGNIEDEVILGDRGRVKYIQPAIWKPHPLWTGKQVITTILINLTYTKPPCNLVSKSRIPAKSWGPSAPEEQEVRIVDNYFVTGILDKSQFGATAHGLVHAVYEVYGAAYAGKLLSIFGRLFTQYLQTAGFSCRMDDLRLTREGDDIRRKLINKSAREGCATSREYVGLAKEGSETDPLLSSRLEGVLRNDEKMAGLDSAMKSTTNKITSEIIASTVPPCLLKPFPKNNMQVMTVSGAKGSGVNVSQISCLLGQQELEGRRVPTMVSGKTLPSFRAFDPSARAGGYITGRFLTGIKPQEYFFHCMAGREGLIDTAVKTSRSGYLQRCLIKHLEGLRVHYDHTVRDSDGSVLQFHYGEDGLDVVKQKTLTKFEFNLMNFDPLMQRFKPDGVAHLINEDTVSKYWKKVKDEPSADPVMSQLSPSRNLGSVSEKFEDEVTEFIKKNPQKFWMKASEVQGRRPTNFNGSEAVKKKVFKSFMHLKYMASLVEPGEAVGLLAAQSIGEPSTQMTLNTFHFAGFGAKNVTLGIPRLREIIMTASTSIKTPFMRLPLLPGVSEAEGLRVAKAISKLTLADITEKVTVKERLLRLDNERVKLLTVRLRFWPQSAYKSEHGLSPRDIGTIVEYRLVGLLDKAIVKELKIRQKMEDVSEEQIGSALGAFETLEVRAMSGDGEGGRRGGDDDDEGGRRRGGKGTAMDDDDDEDAGDDEDDGDADGGDASSAKRSRNRSQHASYDAPDEEDAEAIRAGRDDDEDGEVEIVEMANDDDDDDADDEEDTAKMDEDGNTREDRIKMSAKFAVGYRFDKTNGRWLELDLQFAAQTRKILMVALVEKVLKTVVIHEVPGVSKCYPLPNESENDTSHNLGTEGCNLRGMWDFMDQINVDEIYTNDIAAMLRTYGVEAARASIIQEIASVFGVYGISVDRRHLTLIADYMTFEGGYKPFNRISMNSNPSPFAQMSFETTTNFLTAATMSGDIDDLASPSSRLVLGKVVGGGTGCFDVLTPVFERGFEEDGPQPMDLRA